MAGAIKLKSSTLVETLVAVTVLSIVAALSIGVFLAISTPGSSSGSMMMAQQKSSEMLDTISSYSLTQNDEISISIENLNYRVSFADYQTNVKKAEVEVLDNRGRLVYTRQRLYYFDE